MRAPPAPEADGRIGARVLSPPSSRAITSSAETWRTQARPQATPVREQSPDGDLLDVVRDHVVALVQQRLAAGELDQREAAAGAGADLDLPPLRVAVTIAIT